MGKSLIEIAKAVIQTEAESILALKDRINNDFAKACETLKNCRGKVVLVGMGKSGHIAKKSLQHFHQLGHLRSTCIQVRLVMET